MSKPNLHRRACQTLVKILKCLKLNKSLNIADKPVRLGIRCRSYQIFLDFNSIL